VDRLTSALTEGIATIGKTQQNMALSNAKVGYAFSIELYDDDEVSINLQTGVATPAGDGVLQYTQNTAVGTITATGNASVTVTSSLVTGSPLTVSVPVTNGDTPAFWAPKVVLALAGTSAISDHFTVALDGSDQIRLTAIEAASNDATLNLALANGTCTGITPAPLSDVNASGYPPPSAYRIDPTVIGGNFQGEDLPTDLDAYFGYLCIFDGTAGGVRVAFEDGTKFSKDISPGGVSQDSNPNGLNSMSGSGSLNITSGGNGGGKILLALFCARAS
jgi:hypothetical protein